MPNTTFHRTLERKAFTILQARRWIFRRKRRRESCYFLGKALSSPSESGTSVTRAVSFFSALGLWDQCRVRDKSVREAQGSWEEEEGWADSRPPHTHNVFKLSELRCRGERIGSLHKWIWFGQPTAGDHYFGEIMSVEEKLKPCSIWKDFIWWFCEEYWPIVCVCVCIWLVGLSSTEQVEINLSCTWHFESAVVMVCGWFK